MKAFLLSVLCLVLLAGCRHKELCYDHPHVMEVNVIFDWCKAPEASPQSMSLYLFPESGRRVERYEFAGCKGGRIRVNPGRYRAICLNSDTRNIRIRDNGSFTDFRLTTDDTELHATASLMGVRAGSPPRARNTEDERIAQSPDEVWTGNIGELAVDESSADIILTPEKSFIIFNIEVYNAENLEFAYIISGALTTLSGGYFPGTGTLSDENVTIPFETTFSEADHCIKGGFLTFGHCPTIEFRHFLTLYASMDDGTDISFRFDVTEQIHNAPDPENIVIVLDGLELPEPGNNGGGSSGGLKPDVGEWTSVDIGLKM